MKKHQSVPAQYRQGDVMIERLDKLPAGLKKVPRENGKIVLAKGKANGRAHVITDSGSEMLQDNDGNRFIRIEGEKIKAARCQVCEASCDKVLLILPKLGRVKFLKADVRLSANSKSASVDGVFAIMQHDCPTPDHNGLAVAKGNYANIPQRNVILGDTRNVID